MNDYNIILNEIKKDLQRENISYDSNIISLYDLYYILKLKFEKLHTIIKNDKLFNNMFSTKKRISYNIDSKKITINIGSSSNWDDNFNINREYNKEEIFFTIKTEFSKRFIKKYYYDLVYIFNVIEEYIPLIRVLEKTISTPNEFKCYNLNINLYSLSDIDIRTTLEDNDLNLNYYNKEYLIEMLEESKYELSKKIKVDVNILDEEIKKVVNDYFYNFKEKIKSK